MYVEIPFSTRTKEGNYVMTKLAEKTVNLLISEESRQDRIERLFAIADQLSSLPLPTLTDQEIEDEIQAARMGREYEQ